MSVIIEELEKEQLRSDIPDFKSGDTIKVNVKVKEGSRERIQAFEGVVIRKKNRGINSAFTVRKASSGENVERTFQTHSKMIESIQVIRRGKVRKAKIYYLRERSGKAARIKEKLNIKPKNDTAKTSAKVAEEAQQPATDPSDA